MADAFPFAFTEHDTTTLRARIEHDLTQVARRAAEVDPHLRALVLTGGFSRGEGTARDDAPLNDYDLVAIRRVPGAGPYPALGHALTRELGIEVDLAPVWSARLPHVGAKLFWLDLRLGGRVIHGDPDALRALPALEARHLTRAEVARLLGNRAAGLLLSLPARGERPDERLRDLQATKAVIAAMDALCIHRGRYEPTLRARLAAMGDHPDHAVFETAVRWKLAARADVPSDWWERARDTLLRAVDATRAREARDGAPEHVLHLLRARRIARSPSQAVRARAWDLLATSAWPDGPAGVQWATQKQAFFDARARTLQ